MDAEKAMREKFGDFNVDVDLMRDVYMTDSQRSAYNRILKRALSPPASAAVVPELLGECVEAGTDDDGNVRLTIHTTREALKAAPPMVYRQVRVTLAATPSPPVGEKGEGS